VLLNGSIGAGVCFVLIWFLSGLGEAATGKERPLATNHLGSFLLIPPFYVAMGAVIGWRVVDCTLGCSSWAESAPSISFFTANIMGEGYVLLFMMLVLMAYIFFERVDMMARNRVERETEGFPGCVIPRSNIKGRVPHRLAPYPHISQYGSEPSGVRDRGLSRVCLASAPRKNQMRPRIATG
jgi:hypothetical protein